MYVCVYVSVYHRICLAFKYVRPSKSRLFRLYTQNTNKVLKALILFRLESLVFAS